MRSSIAGLASGFSDSIAGAVTGTATLATEPGQILLASGLGIEALKVSLKSFSGVGAIAAGLGLLAIGGLAKGAMSSLGSTRAAGSGGSSLAITNYGQNSTSTQKLVIETIVRLRGQDLVAIGQQQAFHSRVTG